MAYLDRRQTLRAVWIASSAIVAGGLFGLASFVTADTSLGLALVIPTAAFLALFLFAIRRLTRCPRCGGSALWWSATHTERGPFPVAVLRLEACPYCGYSK